MCFACSGILCFIQIEKLKKECHFDEYRECSSIDNMGIANVIETAVRAALVDDVTRGRRKDKCLVM